MLNGVQLSSARLTHALTVDEYESPILRFSTLLFTANEQVDENTQFIFKLCEGISSESKEMTFSFQIGETHFEPEEINGTKADFGIKNSDAPHIKKISAAFNPFREIASCRMPLETDCIVIQINMDVSNEMPKEFIDVTRRIYEALDFDDGAFPEVIFYLDGDDGGVFMSFQRELGESKMMTDTFYATGYMTAYFAALEEQFQEQWVDHYLPMDIDALFSSLPRIVCKIGDKSA